MLTDRPRMHDALKQGRYEAAVLSALKKRRLKPKPTQGPTVNPGWNTGIDEDYWPPETYPTPEDTAFASIWSSFIKSTPKSR